MNRYSAASIYGIIDRMNAADLEAWLGWHRRLMHPPRFINVFAAARFAESPAILRQVKNALPDTTPIWRGYDGRDAWGNFPPANVDWNDSNFYLRLWNHSLMTPQMAAGLWYARRVKPYLDVIRETGAIVMLLNEASAVFNAPFETECIRILGEEGLRAAAFRWNTGTPDWGEYDHPAIAAEVAMAEKYNALVGTHEYCGLTPELQNSLINRFETLTKRFTHRPDVFIGEFGLALARLENGAIKLDPDAGWLEMGVSEDAYVQFIRAVASTYYIPHKVSFSIFDWIGWGRNGSFGVGRYKQLLDWLAAASDELSFTIEDGPMDTPALKIEKPAEAMIGIRARVKSFGGQQSRNLRASWSYTAADIGDVKVGDLVRRFDLPIKDGAVNAASSGKWCYVEVLDASGTITANGWLWRDGVVWENATQTQEIPVVVVPDKPTESTDVIPDEKPVDPPPVETLPTPAQPAEIPAATVISTKAYALQIEAMEVQHQLIEAALAAILQNIAYLGQAMGNVKITLSSTVVPPEPTPAAS